MSHILRQLGEAALQFRKVGPRKVIAPLLNRRQLKDIREEWLAQGKEWPYEHIYPGAKLRPLLQNDANCFVLPFSFLSLGVWR